MKEDARKIIGEAGKRYLERYEKFDDRAIGAAWVALARREPTVELTTAKGMRLKVLRNVTGAFKVSYEAYLEKKSLLGAWRKQRGRVAWMHCMMPAAGRVQVTNANVYDVGGDNRRQGIGTAIYDLIERDVRAAGAEGIEPHWGSMSDEAIEFWKRRRPDRADQIADLNKMGAGIGSWLFD